MTDVKRKGSILVVEDERSMREVLAIYLKKEGYEASTVENGEQAIRAFEDEAYDIAIVDLQMPGINGLEVLRHIKTVSPTTEVIIITAYATSETGVEAMKAGALDYIKKPFNFDEIQLVIDKVFERSHLVQENRHLKKSLEDRYNLSNIIGRSGAMQSVYDLIEKVAGLDSTVLITGESGTGKEMVAKAIHFMGHRRNKAFVACNCGAFPENLLESELFGHQKGAFTGAISTKIGLLEQADTGTFFLDEVGETPLPIQVKFLRFIQERQFRRVGGIRDIGVDVRLIAATNASLEEMVKKSQFREDLFYRLNVIRLNLPPLRRRTEDIPLLIEHFVKRFCDKFRKPLKTIVPEAMTVLTNYGWPGNVRQLENYIEMMVALEAKDTITKTDLPPFNQMLVTQEPGLTLDIPDSGIDFTSEVEKFEKDLVLKALKKAHWKKKEAADLLQISLRSLRYQLAKHSIDTGDEG